MKTIKKAVSLFLAVAMMATTVLCNTGTAVTAEAAVQTVANGSALKLPTLVSATNSAAGVSTEWKAVSGASKYNVYRRTLSGSWTKIATTTETSYVDKTAANGTMYYYAVECANSSKKVTESTTGMKTVRIVPTLLTSVTNASSSSRKMAVKWRETSTTSTGYQIAYSQSSDFSSGVKTVEITDTTTVSKEISVKTGTTYVRIRVYKIVNGAKYYSAWSSAKSVKITQ